ncbi:MAG: ABC transporter substrate-binding protein [Syntrophorhabdales bacterium]|jgi:ABC-type transporter MlaC component
MKANVALLSVLAAILLIPGQARPAGEATGVVRKMLDSVIAVQTDPALQSQASRPIRRAKIKKVILENFNFEDMAQQSLGDYWKELSASKQQEFKSIFQDLFLDSYSRLVLDFVRKEKIAYLGEEDGQNKLMVKTRIQRVNEEIPVDYYLAEAKHSLLVNDVTIDSVSIVQNYHKSFSRVIKQESYESLLKKMRLQQKAMEKG